MYLGADIQVVEYASEDKWWSISLEKYVKTAIKTLEAKLNNTNEKLPTKYTSPMKPGYHPSMDISEELNSEEMRYFQETIEILR